MIFGNYIQNQEKKLNPMSTKSQLPKFFLGMVYTLPGAQSSHEFIRLFADSNHVNFIDVAKLA